MYLRTTKRKNKDGSVVKYYQLAHNYKDPKTKNSVAEVIYNFGRADKLNREELVRLCKSIARVCGLVVSDPLENPQMETEEIGLPKDIQIVRTLDLGTVLTIEAIWKRLGIEEVIIDICKQSGYKVDYERALFAMTANRLCEPESKLGVWERWLKSKVYIPSCNNLKLPQMYEAMDLLQQNVEKIEEAVFFRTADLFNLEVDIVYYDTTTVSFEINYEDNEKEGIRIRGKSKTGVWSPQIVVALAVTKDGLPVKSWVLPGNTSDTTTVEKVKEDLKGWKLGRSLFIADSGMNSETNREVLAKACGKYILATRMGSIKEIKEEVLVKGGKYKEVDEDLKVKEIEVGNGEKRRRYIVCYNPKEARRQEIHRKEVIQELEEELKKHKELKGTAKWAINLLGSKRYKRYLSINEKEFIYIDKNKIKNAEKFDGKWVLITNDDTISVEDAAYGYKSLMVIERCFRTLKTTQIHIEPVHHRLVSRIEAHVKICVFSLLIERVMELTCESSWLRIKETLSTLQVTEFQTKTHRFFQRNEPSHKFRYALKSLEVELPKKVLDISPIK